MRSYSVNQNDKQDDSGELLLDLAFIAGLFSAVCIVIALFI